MWGREDNPLRSLGFNLALAFLFIRFTSIHEVIASKIGTNGYMLYWFALPAGFCLLLTGGFGRSLQAVQVKYWLGFAFWLLLSVPFSEWVGNSLGIVLTYLRTDFVVLFMISGLAITWKECWRMLNVLAAAAVGVVLIGFIFPNDTLRTYGRLELGITSTMKDSNDYAALLTLVLPFLAIQIVTSRKSVFLRVLSALVTLGGLYLILSTGSRGALLAVIVTVLFVFWILSAPQKLLMAGALILAGGGMLVTLPQSALQRLATTFSSSVALVDNDGLGAAEASANSRIYLLRRSLEYTIQNPLFGVGPGEFADHEGIDQRSQGRQGAWHETHNAYTQVSSEAGIPAALFFIAALISTYRLFRRVYRNAASQPDNLTNRRIRTSVLCLTIGMVGFCSSIFFLSLAYRFYLPALTGIAVVINQAVQREWHIQAEQQAARTT
jgi:O-antigen ligase